MTHRLHLPWEICFWNSSPYRTDGRTYRRTGKARNEGYRTGDRIIKASDISYVDKVGPVNL